MKTNSIVDLTSGAIQTAITEYTHWHHAEAVGNLILSVLVIVICGYIIAKLVKNPELLEDQYCRFWTYLGCASVIIVAALCVPNIIATLTYPKAYAIHQLIEDLRN